MLDYIKQFIMIIIGESNTFNYLDVNIFVDICSCLILALIFYGIVKFCLFLGKSIFTFWR